MYTKIFKRRNALRYRVKYKQILFGVAIYHLHGTRTKVLFWIMNRLDKAHNMNISSLIRPPFFVRLIYRYLYYVLTTVVRAHDVGWRGAVVCRRIQYHPSVHGEHIQKTARIVIQLVAMPTRGWPLICLTDHVPQYKEYCTYFAKS